MVNGPYALHLGRLAHLLGRVDEARELLDRAARSCAAGDCVPWAARVAEAQATLGGTTRSLPAGLTEREAEMLRLVAQGATNAEIAERTYLAVKTVERHLVNAYRKAGVKNRAEATAYTLRHLSP